VKNVWLLLALAACPRSGNKTIEPTQKKDARLLAPDDGSAATVELPPAPPLPEVPKGLPPVEITATPELVAFGAAMFAEPRLSSTGKLSCATCHDPDKDYSGTRQPTAAGQMNLRRTMALANVAWNKELGWDGRYGTLDDQLAAHVTGQLGDPAAAATRLVDDPTYRAHVARTSSTLLAALRAFVLTRYEGGSTWDREEGLPVRGTTKEQAERAAGYALFMGKAQCAVCHPPPLYTDNGYHRLGLIASHDEGRGRIDPKQQGAFATPTLRGAARRPAFFHDGSAQTLDAAIDWHLAGGTGQSADPKIIDPALKKIALSADERAQLGAFVRALTRDAP
jgi:cytochrome c peroxidase